jgi:hypothetical protein
MKGLTLLLLLTASLALNSASAQDGNFKQQLPEKPLLFQSAPEKVNCTFSVLTNLLTATEGMTVSLNIAGNFRFDGVVTYTGVQYGKLKTVLVKSTNFPGALLTFNQLNEGNNGMRYHAIIHSMQHGDMYEMTKEKDNSYVFIKKKTNQVVME